MADENLALWESVEKTDPKHVKAITGKPYKGSSPAPHWIVRKATETFGPCGIGWGFTVAESQFVPSHNGVMHFAKVRVWYEWKGKRGEVEHVGGTPFQGENRNGPFSDEDAPKKSVTDALVKALSMIGFAGDIFLGRWDDSKYQAELREEFAERPRGSMTVTSGPPASAEQLIELEAEIKRTGRSLPRLLKHYGLDNLTSLTEAQAATAIKICQTDAPKAAAE